MISDPKNKDIEVQRERHANKINTIVCNRTRSLEVLIQLKETVEDC